MFPDVYVKNASLNFLNLCFWMRETEEDCVWRSSCEHDFEFNDGGPRQNGWEYCPYCGRIIVEAQKS